MSPPIDVARVKRKYRWNALVYDAVLDFGCGTGLSFALLEGVVGDSGRIVGVDVSPDMLAVARAHVAANGWRNLEIVEASADDAPVASASVDGVLCFYTHDIMRSPSAVDTALRALRPGGRFVAAGVKLMGGLRGALLNPFTLAVSAAAITNADGFDRPWSLLEQRLAGLGVEEHLWGSAYLAVGTKPPVTP